MPPTVPSPPSTPTLLLPLPTTTLPRPPMATTLSLVLPTCTLLVLLCTDVRSARLRSPSLWLLATHTPPTLVGSSVTSPLWLPPSLLTPTVPSFLLSLLMLLRPARLTLLLLPRPAGRSVKLRCPSTLSLV